MNEIVMHDVIILGSGPAGLTAALYCARGGKKTLVLGGDTLGGQTAGIAKLENYPGWATTARAMSGALLLLQPGPVRAVCR